MKLTAVELHDDDGSIWSLAYVVYVVAVVVVFG